MANTESTLAKAHDPDHGLTQPGSELALEPLIETMNSDALEALDGSQRLFKRVVAKFTDGGMSWDEFAQTVNGVCEHLSDVVGADIYIRQYNDEAAALAVIRVLVEDKNLVARIEVPHHAIMKAPAPPRPEADDDDEKATF